MTRALTVALVVLVMVGGATAQAAPTVSWRLVDVRPHDPTAFTQGLVAHRGALLESTGLYGQSSVRRLDARTGRVLTQTPLPASQFGEGLTVFGGRALQLTWTQNVIHSYDPVTLRRTATRGYRWEGWGLTTNGRELIASDGSATIRFLDPTTLRVVRTIQVRDRGRAVSRLNELEYRNGVLWANVWYRDRIALINPATGRVRAWVDCAPLRRRLTSPGDVLNGIARDPVTGHTAVTGKLWSQLFVIRLTSPIPA